MTVHANGKAGGHSERERDGGNSGRLADRRAEGWIWGGSWRRCRCAHSLSHALPPIPPSLLPSLPPFQHTGTSRPLPLCVPCVPPSAPAPSSAAAVSSSESDVGGVGSRLVRHRRREQRRKERSRLGRLTNVAGGRVQPCAAQLPMYGPAKPQERAQAFCVAIKN